MKIVNKPYMEWSPADRKRFRSLSLRSTGDMCKALVRKKCDTFVVFDDQNVFVGWGVYVMEPWYHEKLPGDFSVYVRKSYRKKGIGKMIAKVAIEKYGSLRVHPWDCNSGKFFSKMIKEEGTMIVVRGECYLDGKVQPDDQIGEET